MSADGIPRWLAWAREIQALSQTGLTYCRDAYDRQRYERLAELAAEIIAEHAGASAGPIARSFAAQVGYATPKVDVRAACVHQGRILLVQERSDGGWCMPGGWADVGDSPAASAVRETWEESGLRAEARALVGLYDANRTSGPLELYHAYKCVFLCDILGGEPRPSDETLAVDFFSFDALPPLSPERTSERHLRDVRARLEDPGRPTSFD